MPLIEAGTPLEELPWANWGEPSSRNVKTQEIRASVEDGRLLMGKIGEQLGVPTTDALRSFSTRIGYPTEFVSKLRPELQADIINDRILSYRDTDFSLVYDDTSTELPNLVSIVPGTRVVMPHATVAQVAYDTLREVFPSEPLDVRIEITPSTALIRMQGPFDMPVRADGVTSVGDVLRMGVEVSHMYGVDLTTKLYTVRLRCTNGMTAYSSEYGWSSRITGTLQMQRDWLRVGVANALSSFPSMMERARLMASTNIEGDPQVALLERARSIRLPKRLFGELVKMFNEEPGTTEWDMLNAFTRLATHGGLSSPVMRSLMDGAGSWVAGFDMVTARLPRPLAASIGAHVIEEEAPSLVDGSFIDV